MKEELYTIVDAGMENAIGFKTGLEDNPNHKHGVDSVNYEERPSEFLEQAYATQTYDAQGVMQSQIVLKDILMWVWLLMSFVRMS